MGNKLIFTCLRNEGPFLLEWVGHHLSLGFDRFCFFTNDCEDGTDAMCDRLVDLGIATHVRNIPGKRGPQWTALNHPDLVAALAGADWAMHLDADEFLNVEDLRTLTDLDADAVSVPWRFFGSAGVAAFEDSPVVRQFTRCSPYPIDFPRQALMFKTLFRPASGLNRPGVHAPRPAKGRGRAGLSWVNGSGLPLSRNFAPHQNPILYGPDAGNTLAQINHYALKSRQSFLIKAARGLPNHGNVPVDLGYWARRNFNDVEDRRLADRTDTRDSRLDDPALQDLHRRAVAWYRTRIDDILATPQGVEFYANLAVVGDSIVPNDREVRTLYGLFGRVFGPGSKNG